LGLGGAGRSGAGGNRAGGAGGGGYYGGGGGGTSLFSPPSVLAPAGGGGGGSNLVPQGGSATLTEDTTIAPSVTISYQAGGVGEEPPTEPQTKEDCKKGGFREFGFKNQGQCIKAVNHPS